MLSDAVTFDSITTVDCLVQFAGGTPKCKNPPRLQRLLRPSVGPIERLQEAGAVSAVEV